MNHNLIRRAVSSSSFMMSSSLVKLSKLQRTSCFLSGSVRTLDSMYYPHYHQCSSFATKNLHTSLPEEEEEEGNYDEEGSTFDKKNKIKNPNNRLSSIKEQGLTTLTQTSTTISSKTKKRLLVRDEDTGPSVAQLQESKRIHQLLETVIEEFTSRNQNGSKSSLFTVNGEPIVILDVEITEDLRQARAYWALPYSILLMDDDFHGKSRRGRNELLRKNMVDRMQQILDTRGKVLQGMVHHRMRMYRRPPMIRFVPAENEMLRSMLQDLI